MSQIGCVCAWQDVDMLDREFAQHLATRIQQEPDTAQFAKPASLPANVRPVAQELQVD